MKPVQRSVWAVVAATLLASCGQSPESDPPAQAAAPPPPGSCSVDGVISLAAAGPAGPAALHLAPPVSQVLLNHDARFQAAPILVSGHEAYVNGEYLYQDHIYDDYGADTSGQPTEAALTTAITGSSTLDGLNPTTGDLTYPDDFDRFGGNAADIAEFRIAPTSADVAYRITLTTAKADDAAIIAIAWDSDNNALTPVAGTMPRNEGVSSNGAEEIIYLWGTSGEHVDVGSGVVTPLSVSIDTDTNQMTAVLPRTLHNPTGMWHATLLAGIHDGAGGFAEPGGGGSSPRVMNVGFRFDEYCLQLNTPCDTRQGIRLRDGDISAFRHGIDFAALAAGSNSNTVPATGRLVRIFPTRHETGEGRVLTDDSNIDEYRSELQPYSIYIPSSYSPGTESPMVLLGHSRGQGHWQYNGSNFTQQVGEERDAIVLTPLSRGRYAFYIDEGEIDTFEAWADARHHYDIDMSKVAFVGYSMGGYMTFRLGGLYPDLVGRAFTQVGPPAAGIWTGQGDDGSTGGFATLSNMWLENFRNIPIFNMVAVPDELVPISGARQQSVGGTDVSGLAQSFEDLAYRFVYQEFINGEHYYLFLHDNYPDGSAYLDESEVNPNPHHITFSYIPATDNNTYGMIHDKAYWLSHLRLRDLAEVDGRPAKGTIDVVSHGFGLGEPVSTADTPTAGVLTGNTGAVSYTQQGRSWADAPVVPAENKLSITVTNLNSVQLDLARASLSTAEPLTLEVTSDGNTTLDLAGSFASVASVTIDGQLLCTAIVGVGGARLPVVAGTHTYVITP